MTDNEFKVLTDEIQYDFNFQEALVSNDPEMMAAVFSDYGLFSSVQNARELIINLKKGTK